MKKIIILLIIIGTFGVVLYNIDPIARTVGGFMNGYKKVVIAPSDDYKKEDSFLFVKPVSDYIPYSYNDLINIYYSFINNGWDSFTFYCPSEYKECLDDVEKIRKDKILLSNINNFAHPFNSYENINTAPNRLGEVTLKSTKLYSDEDIAQINEKVDEIIDELFIGEDDLDDTAKIMKVHDYIINNTRYDIDRANDGESPYRSNTAYGVLFDGYAVCSGYADTMAIFLSKLGYTNYKIATDEHVWNAVYYQDETGKMKWAHVDLTWDDPVDYENPSVNYLKHKYFLVNNSTLFEEDASKTDENQTYANHKFDQSVYLEFKED